MNQPIPLRLDPSAITRSATQSYVRAAAALALTTQHNGADAAEIIRREWAGDRAAEWLTRASSAPTSLGSTAPLAQVKVTDLLLGLAPGSGALKLFTLCPTLDFSQAAQFAVPVPVSYPVIPFIGEGSAIPVGQEAFASVVVGPPSKLAFIVAVSREVLNQSGENASTVISTLLSESIAKSLDGVVFDNLAAVAYTRPAGLLNGITALTPTPAASTILDTLVGDIAEFADSFTAAGLNAANAVMVANSKSVVRYRLTRGYDPTAVDIISSPALLSGVVVAAIPAGIYCGYDGIPRIEVSSNPALVMTDPASEMVAIGGAVGNPAMSMFQQDLVAIKLVFHATWAVVAPGAVSYVSAANW